MAIFAIENPIKNIPGLVAYYDARNINGNNSQPSIGAISSWKDLSGNSNTGSQGTGALQPSYNYATYNRPSVYFDGSRDIPAANSVSLNFVNTSFQTVSAADVRPANSGIMAKDISGIITNPAYEFSFQTSANFTRIALSDNTQLTRSQSDSNLSTPVFLSSDYNGTTFVFYSNNSTTSTSSSGNIATTTGSLRIGQQKNGNGRFLTGNIFIISIFNRNLSTAENNIIRRYYGNIFGINLTAR